MTVLHFSTLTQAATLVSLTISFISKDQIDKARNSMTTGNGNENVMKAKIDPFIFIVYDENSILITFLIKISTHISDLEFGFRRDSFLLVSTLSNIVKY
jgi:hypothetical protein